MGISANRRPGEAAQLMGQPQRQVYTQEPLPKTPPVMDTLQSGNLAQPFQAYPRLQQMMRGSGFGAILGNAAMQGMEQRRMAAGMTPEAWQAQINANLGARRRRF
jgi:hypothetical protein